MDEWFSLKQAERVKGWCRKYSVWVMIGMVLIILGSVVWYSWHRIEENRLMRASLEYDRLSVLLEMGQDDEKINAIADDLLEKYSQTPYACLTALQLAKRAVYRSDLVGARTRLLWVVQHGKSATLQTIARIRLARILLAEHQTEQALHLLAVSESQVYTPLILEGRGDIFLELGRKKEALQNYLAAQKAFSRSAFIQPSLAMKIDNLI